MIGAGAVVVDASLAMAWVLQEVHTAAAWARLNAWDRAGIARLAPALFAAETASACRRRLASGLLPGLPAARRALTAVLSAVTIQPDDHGLAPRALEIATAIGAGRAYDCLYIALAERQGVELWTGDERLYNAAHPTFLWVHWEGEPP